MPLLSIAVGLAALVGCGPRPAPAHAASSARAGAPGVGDSEHPTTPNSTVPVSHLSAIPSPSSLAASGPPPRAPSRELLESYGETARRIRDASLGDDGAFQKLSVLTDTIGQRVSGSASLEKAVAWAQRTFIADGQERVALEPVRVPHWVRGAESAAVLTPFPHTLAVSTLGGSVATPGAGITAELLVVGSFEELAARKAEARGKIVLFDHAMASTGNAGKNYGDAIAYRVMGAARAAPFGAQAVLVRSLTARSLGSPHTGSMRYPDDKALRIPAAALSVEDAMWLHRLAERGEKITVRLSLSARTLPDADSANVLAEIRGRDLANEVVLIGAHLDSWDIGQGAQDDGAGVVVVMQALATLRKLGLVPRRTLRAVLFTNEENGVRGAAQYEREHHAERHAAAFEMDAGAGAPLGFMTDGEQPFLGEAGKIAALLAPLGAGRVIAGFAGEDVGALAPERVPLFGVMLDIEHYFDVHHSAADTLDKVDPENLRRTVAALATMAFVVADREGTWTALPTPPPPVLIPAAPSSATPSSGSSSSGSSSSGSPSSGSPSSGSPSSGSPSSTAARVRK